MNVHHCDACGWETKTPDHVVQVFHPCQTARTRRQLRKLDPNPVVSMEERAHAERAAWARDKLGPLAGAFEEAVDEEALLRRLEPD